MPLALDPKRKNKIVLNSDEDKPEASRPAFIFNFLNGRQCRILAEFDEKIVDSKDNVEACDLTFETLRKFLIGWENMIGRDGKEIPFDLEVLEDIVGVMEATEVIQRLLRTRPDFLKKEPSELPSVSDTDVLKAAPSAPES